MVNEETLRDAVERKGKADEGLHSLGLPFVCHELRTPVIAEQELMRTLQEECVDLERFLKGMDETSIDSKLKAEILRQLELQRSTLGTIDACVKYQYVAINDVLDFSKLKAGQLELNMAPMNPKKIIESVLDILKIQFKSKNIKASVIYKSIYWQEYILGDELRFKQILLNLVNNAVKFTPNNGVVTITFYEPKLDRDNILLTFSIEDTGVGIPQAKMPTLFTPYGDPTLMHQGPGLGLAISKALVTLMGGDIRVTSSCESACHGTKVSFYIKCKHVPSPNHVSAPKHVSDPKHVPDPHKAASPALVYSLPRESKGKILIADDVEINRKIMMRGLSQAGYECVCAEDGVAAVKLCCENDFVAVLMDLSMPVMDGKEATRTIRNQEKATGKKSVLIFACTAMPLSAEVQQEFIEGGMNGFLEKPCNVQTMMALIVKCRESSVFADTVRASSAQSDPLKVNGTTKAQIGGSLS